MEGNYDLNEFFAVMLRRWRTVIFIIFAITAGWSGVRVLNSYLKYNEDMRTYLAAPVTETTEVNQVSEIPPEPMMNVERVIIKIENNGTDSEYTETMSALCRDSSIMQMLRSRCYDMVSDDYKNNMENLLRYGYLTEASKKIQFSLYEFQQRYDFEILNSTYVAVSCVAFDSEVASLCARIYAELLMSETDKRVPEESSSISGGSSELRLPDAAPGAVPVRFIESQIIPQTSPIPAPVWDMKAVLMDGVKACVWGAILGAVLAIAYVFVIYISDRYICKFSDLRRCGLSVYGVYYKGIFSKVLEKLEGNKSVFTNEADLIKMVLTDIKFREGAKNVSVIITGCVKLKKMDDFTVKMNSAAKESGLNVNFVLCDLITASSDTVEMCEKIKNVIFIEKMGKSPVYEYDREIEYFRKHEVEILGVIGLE